MRIEEIIQQCVDSPGRVLDKIAMVTGFSSLIPVINICDTQIKNRIS